MEEKRRRKRKSQPEEIITQKVKSRKQKADDEDLSGMPPLEDEKIYLTCHH